MEGEGAARRGCLVPIVGVLVLIVAAVFLRPALISQFFAPTCEGTRELVFADGSTVPLCNLTSRTYADGGEAVSLGVGAALPGRGPYGAGTELAAFSLSVNRFTGSSDSGRAEINVLPDAKSLWGLGGTVDWRGPCRVQPDAGVLAISCVLEADPGGVGKGRGSLTVRTELPLPADPRSDPAFRWLEVTYAVTGGYTATGGTLVVLDANQGGSWVVLGFHLPAGDGLFLAPGAEGAPQARIALAAEEQSSAPGYDLPAYRGDVEFADCTSTIEPDRMTGRMSCRAGRYVPATDIRPVDLEVSWRPAP